MAGEDPVPKPNEADPVDQSPFKGDSKPDQGASLGEHEHCVSDRPTPAGEVPTGELSKLGEVDVYIAKPNDYPHSPSKLLLLLTGGTGIQSQNNQIQADKFAAEGFLVVMPDQFGGEPAPNSEAGPAKFATSDPSMVERFKLGAVETAKSFFIDMWLARHTPEKVLPILQKVIESAKEEFADAVANGNGIYAVGYCIGAKYVMLLAGDQSTKDRSATDEESAPAGEGPKIKVGAVAHGADIRRDDLEAIRAPISLICVENDSLFPEEVLEAGRQSLKENKVDHEIEVIPDVPHGFAVIGDYQEAHIKDAQSRAFEKMLAWLTTH